MRLPVCAIGVPLCEFALHPMLVAQLRSVRDEATHGPYVEWFASSADTTSRLYVTAEQNAFSYVWSPIVFSWVFPPTQMVGAATAKFLFEGSRGTMIVPHAPNERWFRDLVERASLSFEIQGHELNLVPSQGTVRLTAFIIDATDAKAQRESEPRQLCLPDGCDRLFRTASCPFNYEAWVVGLAHYPDASFVTRVTRGILYGRSMQYYGPRLVSRECKNPQSFERHKAALLAIMAKDEGKQFRCGPFPGQTTPLFNLICNPVHGAAKRFNPDDIRFVKDLSFPHNGSSVNALTAQGVTHNITVDTICALIAHFGKGTLIWSFDVQSAYKLIKVVPDDWHLQGEMSELGYAWSSVFDFGGSQSGHNWHEYGSAIEFMIRHHSFASAITRYVDDFCGLTRPLSSGKPDFKRAGECKDHTTALCDRLGVPIPLSKQKGPDTRIVGLLGWTVDTMTMQLSMTDERRRMCLAMLSDWLKKRHATMHDLQSLVGTLAYLVTCFRWGKAFLGHAIKLSHTKKKPHDTIKLKDAFRAELSWWVAMVDKWDGISLFYEHQWITSSSLGFEVDASRKGHGAWADPHWYSRPWSASELLAAKRNTDVSMPYLEALGIAYGCATFGHSWSGKKMYVLSDCQPAEAAINARYSRNVDLQRVIRSIGTMACRFNFDLRVRHIEGLKNVRADPLSRLDIPAFHTQAPYAASLQTPVLLPPGLT